MAKNSSDSPFSIHDQVLSYLYYALFFFSPLVMWTRTSEIFEFNKMLFVYLITILVSLTWLAKSINTKRFILARSFLDLPLMLFLLSQVLSTIFSIDRHTSLWGYYSRFHGGLMSTLSYTILTYGYLTHFQKNKKVFQYSLISLVTSLIFVSLYGVFEHFGIDKNMWVQDVQNRVFSTLGQPNWLSALLVAVLPLTLMRFLNHPLSLSQKYFYGLTSLLLFVTILFTKSRSGIGATILILFLIFLYQLRQIFKDHKNTTKQKFSLVTLLSFLGLLLIALFIGTPWTPNPNDIQRAKTYGGPAWSFGEKYLNKIGLTSAFKPVQVDLLTETEQREYQQRQQGLRVGGSNSMDIRRIVWKGALDLVKQHPILGTGVETFGYSYYWVRPVEHNYLSEWDFLYNKAHNEYLNFAATTGLFGLATYLFLIFSIGRTFFVSSDLSQTDRAAFFFGFLSILVTNYYGFSVVCVALLFFLFPALSLTQSDDYIRQNSVEIEIDHHFAYLALVIIGFFSLQNIYQQWQSDIYYNQAKIGSARSANYLVKSIESIEAAIKLNPHEPLYNSQLADLEAQAASSLNQQLLTLEKTNPNDQKLSQYQSARDEYYQKSLNHSQASISQNPYNLNFYKNHARVSLFLATINPQVSQEAVKALLKVIELAPTDPKTLYNLGALYQNLGMYPESKIAYQNALKLKSDYQEAQAQLNQIDYLSTTSATTK